MAGKQAWLPITHDAVCRKRPGRPVASIVWPTCRSHGQPNSATADASCVCALHTIGMSALHSDGDTQLVKRHTAVWHCSCMSHSAGTTSNQAMQPRMQSPRLHTHGGTRFVKRPCPAAQCSRGCHLQLYQSSKATGPPRREPCVEDAATVQARNGATRQPEEAPRSPRT
jgi:hypothetical protein